MSARHSLTDKDTAALTATCSICGPLSPITGNGKGRFACAEGRRLSQIRFRQAHPDRVREMKKRPPSKHRLEKRDGSPDTCSVCGPVTPRAVGRGWACPVREDELGRRPHADAPQPRCLLCRTFLDRYGACAKCDDDLSDLDTAYMPKESRAAMRDFRQTAAFYEDGFSILDPSNPYLLDSGYESAVDGWTTLGSDIPEKDGKVLDAYAVLYGSGRR